MALLFLNLKKGNIKKNLKLITLGFLSILFACAIGYRFYFNLSPCAPGIPGLLNSAPDPTTDSITEELVQSGWNRDAAKAVVMLNSDIFSIQKEENPKGFDLNLKLLKGLGKNQNIQSLIEEHPELALLLAGAEYPDQVAGVIISANEDYEIVLGMFIQHFSPQDSTRLALALKNNRDLICNLIKQGTLNSEVCFLFDRDAAGADEYEVWLREILLSKSVASDDEFASFFRLVLSQGNYLRSRFQKDEDFRSKFRAKLWPSLVRAVSGNQGMIEMYLDENRIWDLLALENGEALLKQWGLVPIDLFFGYEAIRCFPYPKELHGRIAQMLFRNKFGTVEALTNSKFRSEPLFHELLKRPLSDNTIAAALNNLFQSGTNYPEKLALYARISDSALAEEVGPEPSGIATYIPFYYTVYEVPKKLLQGRDPTGWDMLSAGTDIIFLIPDILSVGTTTAPRKALIAGGKAGVKQLGEKAIVTNLTSSGTKLATKALGKEVAEKLAEKALFSWTATAGLSEIRQMVRTTIGKVTTFEITKPVKLMFELSGASRESWKRFTNLEARLFMRGDAKVFVQLEKIPANVLGPKGAGFLNMTARELSIGTIVESQPGQDVIKTALDGGTIAAKTLLEQKVVWQKHISAWWLLNNSYLEN